MFYFCLKKKFKTIRNLSLVKIKLTEVEIKGCGRGGNNFLYHIDLFCFVFSISNFERCLFYMFGFFAKTWFNNFVLWLVIYYLRIELRKIFKEKSKIGHHSKQINQHTHHFIMSFVLLLKVNWKKHTVFSKKLLVHAILQNVSLWLSSARNVFPCHHKWKSTHRGSRVASFVEAILILPSYKPCPSSESWRAWPIPNLRCLPKSIEQLLWDLGTFAL